jgi:multicomponent Na+:H+ antiporter subunit E
MTGVFASFLTVVIYYWLKKHAGIKIDYSIKTISIIKYIFIVIFEIFKSTIRHMYRIIFESGETQIIEIELRVKNEIAFLLISNAITLTPGTATIQMIRNQVTILKYIGSEKDDKDLKQYINKLENIFYD